MNTPADIAATPCPGCMLQINDWLSRKKSRVKAMHPVELMAMSFGYKKK